MTNDVQAPTLPDLDPWKRASARFLEKLSDDHKHLFHEVELERLYYNASLIQRDYENHSKARKVQKKLQPLVDALEGYGSALDVYANASSEYLCPVWGSIRVVFILLHSFQRYFDKILDAFSEIGRALPFWREYEAIFSDNLRLMNLLTNAYLEIIEFCVHVKELYCHEGHKFRKYLPNNNSLRCSTVKVVAIRF